MAHCYFNGISNSGNQKWGRWILTCNIEDNIVKYCRNAFKNKYRDMWINPVYFDDKYINFTDEFFSEVGVELYPKITNLQKELKSRGFDPQEDWYNYKSIIWEIVHADIDENIRKGVKPVFLVINGVRYPSEDDFKEQYKSIYVRPKDKIQ